MRGQQLSVDPELPVLAFKDSTNQLRAVIFNHSTHTIGTRAQGKRSPSFYGLAAQELAKAGRRPLPGELFFRPFFSFFHLYFIRRGFLEGTPGYTLAVLMSMYKFLKYYYLRELARGRDLDGR